jgi:hypothetical protein
MKNILNKAIEFLFGCNPKVGETWGFVVRQKNPFMDAVFYKVEILDVKNGWVKYLKPDEGETVAKFSTFKYIYSKLEK